jgi:serine/threonine protein kinase
LQLSPDSFFCLEGEWRLLPSLVVAEVTMQSSTGDPSYVAPEGEKIFVLQKNIMDEKFCLTVILGTMASVMSDVWSLGVLLFDCRFGYNPFHHANDNCSTIARILVGLYTIPDCSPYFRQLISKILCGAAERLSFPQLIACVRRRCFHVVVLLLCCSRFRLKQCDSVIEWLPRDVVVLICKSYLLPHQFDWGKKDNQL